MKVWVVNQETLRIIPFGEMIDRHLDFQVDKLKDFIGVIMFLHSSLFSI